MASIGTQSAASSQETHSHLHLKLVYGDEIRMRQISGEISFNELLHMVVETSDKVRKRVDECHDNIGDCISISYIDEDGDCIKCCNNEDLHSAMRYHFLAARGKVMKLQVEVHESKHAQAAQPADKQTRKGGSKSKKREKKKDWWSKLSSFLEESSKPIWDALSAGTSSTGTAEQKRKKAVSSGKGSSIKGKRNSNKTMSHNYHIYDGTGSRRTSVNKDERSNQAKGEDEDVDPVSQRHFEKDGSAW
eukprot:gb/GECG01006069.1/.p1 GENE.gb/GECG01006069.1/~~gb/GECG01006069.1/.p1  ORF type:complete len:247 (+),score=46.41 gb/GECG01006069.1/:1-741(+)